MWAYVGFGLRLLGAVGAFLTFTGFPRCLVVFESRPSSQHSDTGTDYVDDFRQAIGVKVDDEDEWR